MKQFKSIEKIDTGILYALELTSSVSILLLAFGLIASMANVLTKGSVLTENLVMQRIWAWTQCIAIDASVAGTILRTFQYHAQGEWVKTWLHGLLSVLLLFTAAIVSTIESVQQTLNVTLDAAYVHVFIPVEVLIWIRSIAIVLLIVAYALRHVQDTKPEQGAPAAGPSLQSTPLVFPPELMDALRVALAQVTISEKPQTQQVLPSPHSNQQTNTTEQESEYEMNNYERVRAYLTLHPKASDSEIANTLMMSRSTANKWHNRVKETCSRDGHCQ